MAKDGLKAEAARQELIAELTGLKKDNLKSDGKPKKDATPQEVKRITEIERMLETGEIPPHATPSGVPPPPTTPMNAETDAQKVKRLERENKVYRDKETRGRDAAKIQSVNKTKIGHVKRPDEIMGEGLAIAEDTAPANWGDNIKLAVEREIRRVVRKGGSHKNYKGDFYELPAGFKKGIARAEKVRALDQLEKLGRIGSAAEIIALIDERETSLTTAQKRQTNKEFNQQLEGLGVAWDDSIQVPGMSMTLRS